VNLSECIELYVDMKHKNGHPYTSSAGRLRAFAKKIGDVQLGAVKLQHVVEFIDTPGTSPITQRFKYGLLHNFFLYCQGRYPMGNIPMPPKPPSPPPTSFIPLVYSRGEIRALLRAIAPAQTGMRCMIPARTFRTFLLFLYGTGASISEAHRMLLKDVDLKRRRIIIRDGPFGRARTIPIGFDLYRSLAAYIGFRSDQKGSSKANRLFIDKRGQPINLATLQITFRRTCRIACLSHPDVSKPPCMRDLRSAFVVHRLNAWSKSGVDLRAMLPALSAYMGLVGLSSSERYLRLTPERFRRQLNLLSPRQGRSHWRDDKHLMRFVAQL
jgi:integrase/recombinase XerD